MRGSNSFIAKPHSPPCHGWCNMLVERVQTDMIMHRYKYAEEWLHATSVIVHTFSILRSHSTRHWGTRYHSIAPKFIQAASEIVYCGSYQGIYSTDDRTFISNSPINLQTWRHCSAWMNTIPAWLLCKPFQDGFERLFFPERKINHAYDRTPSRRVSRLLL